MEHPPSSPFVSLGLLPPMSDPSAHNKGQLSHDDLVLPYISHMLMEDNIDDTILSQYYDHPALLQAQQGFAQILSSPSIGADCENTASKGNVDKTNDLLQVCSSNQSTFSSAFSNPEHAVEAFFKGVEEASMLLPRDNSVMNDHQMDEMLRKRSCHRHLKEVGSTREVMMTMEEPEETGIHEMFNDMMLHGYKTFFRDMEKQRTSMKNEAKKNNGKGSNKVAGDMVDLNNLLICCAQAVDTNNFKFAGELLKQIKQHASATGDAMQRLALYFSKGLEARLMGTGSQLSKLLMAERPSAVDFCKAYSLYVAACSFNKVAHIFSTTSIMQAMVGKSRLHIVDYCDMCFEFQWAGLIRLLANRAGDPPEIKITAVSGSQPRSCPSQWIEEQEHRLNKCASEFGMPFKFQAITMKREEVSIENLNIDADEVLVVNDLFSFSSLMDHSVCFDKLSPRDTVLNNIRKMRPNIFIQSILNGSYSTAFLSRFRETLFRYSALFDMLDAIVPRDSEPRLVLEGLLGCWALNAIACEGEDLIEHHEKYRQWQVRNRRAGLRQLPLEPDIVKVLKDMVKKHLHKEFFLSQDGQWLLQGWKGRILFAHSTWVAEDASPE